MAATSIITQTTDYTKHGYHKIHHDHLDNIKEPKQIIVPSKQVSKQQQQQEVISPKKYSFYESESMRQGRLHSLSHWTHITPSSESMASAGWFSCNVTDRVICIYCNTICHEWTFNDDPVEVHARLAPRCPFVLSMASSEEPKKIINDNFAEKFEPTNPLMAEISRREATFAKITWPENAPSIENLVRAGFFFSGSENIVTCFCCNGSLHKWGANDNPMIEHARWFPNCIYAKHLCGNDLYRKIQSSKKRVLPQNQLTQNELSQLVSARLDLPNVQCLRSEYQLPVIKRCIEDQFRIKNDDFKTDTDLKIACMILKKQMEIIKGCKDKLIVPSENQKSDKSTKSSKQSLGECLICLTEEKQLACMPCGHLCACVPCGYALKSCPVCRQKIQSFMRITS